MLRVIGVEKYTPSYIGGYMNANALFQKELHAYIENLFTSDIDNLDFEPSYAYSLADVHKDEVIDFCNRNDLKYSDELEFSSVILGVEMIYRFILFDKHAVFKLRLAGLVEFTHE